MSLIQKTLRRQPLDVPLKEEIDMRQSKIINKLSLGIACLLGLGTAVTAGMYLSSNQNDFKETEAATDYSDVYIGQKRFYRNSTSWTYTSSDVQSGESASGTATIALGNTTSVTFDNFSYSGPGYSSETYFKMGVYISPYERNCEITLIGDNHITVTGDDYENWVNGFYVATTYRTETITFKGTGSLTVDFTGTNRHSKAIVLVGRTVIDSEITLNGYGGTARCSGIIGESTGVSVMNITMNKGTINATGGSATDSYGTKAYGFHLDDIQGDGTSYFNGGTINASTNTTASSSLVQNNSLTCAFGVSDSNAYFRGTTINAISSSVYPGKTSAFNFDCYEEDPKSVCFEGGEINLTAVNTNNSKVYGISSTYDYGSIYASKDALLTITGSTRVIEKPFFINRIKGEGWNTVAGEGDSELIYKVTEGQAYTYKKAYFEKLPGVIEEIPTAKLGLEYTGTNQVLIDGLGSSSTGTMQYKVDTGSWSSELPVGSAKKTFKVYYRSVATDNLHEDVDTGAYINVVIGPADKTALSNKLNQANALYNELVSTYPEACALLKEVIDNAQATHDKANPTVGELKEACDSLDDAMNNVLTVKNVIDLINKIGEVTLTSDCKAKIDAANSAYNSLGEAYKEFVSNKKTLFDALERYALLDHQDKVVDNNVKVTGKNGDLIPVNVSLKVELKEKVEAKEGTTEYEAIQKMLNKGDKISNVFDIKLIKNEGGVETEIQPSDIKEGMIINIEIALPDGLEVEGLKILHIHSSDDITYVEDYSMEDGKISFDANRLSEFAFVVPGHNAGIAGWAIALIVIASFLVLLCLAYVILFFVLNKYIISVDRKVMRVFVIKKHHNDVTMIDMYLRRCYRKSVDVYDTKEAAEASLNRVNA